MFFSSSCFFREHQLLYVYLPLYEGGSAQSSDLRSVSGICSRMEAFLIPPFFPFLSASSQMGLPRLDR